MNTLKRKGECAELAFLLKAATLGLTVAKPYGDSARFDVITIAPALLSRVQIKSTSTARPLRSAPGARNRPPRSARQNPPPPCAWYLNCATGKDRRLTYTSADIDFLAACIVPEDIWYIIPVAAIQGRRTLRLSPHHPRQRARYEPFREAWHLLLA